MRYLYLSHVKGQGLWRVKEPLDYEEVKSVLLLKLCPDNRPEIVKVLISLGAKSLSTLDPHKRRAFKRFLETLPDKT